MNAVDLFAGCGGLSMGAINSGVNLIAAYEIWEPAIDVYKRNFSHPVYNLDLSDVNRASKHIKVLKPDIVIGGPPCQDFSSAGKRNENGQRGNLTLSFAEIVCHVNPTWFLMENVDRTVKTTIYKEAKTILKTAGYGLTEVVLDASFCGVPQKRKRMFLIGKKSEKPNFLSNLIRSRLSSKPMTVRDYFGKALDLEFYYRHARSYQRRGVFSVDEPSPTIRGVNRPIPPNYKPHNGDATRDLEKVRPLTTEERALIQTFPEDFDWAGLNKTVSEQIIGNAVPVKLAEFVMGTIKDYNDNRDVLVNYNELEFEGAC